MNYRDVYFSRINHMGDSTAERIREGGIRSFYKWMAESPHTVRNLSIERGLFFDGIILTNKDKEAKKIMLLNVANTIPLQIGDIMNWTIDDGSIEKWIIIQEEKKVNGTYKTFWIVRCNYLLKWVDAQGHLQQSWSYFVSSLDSKIKGNYRTWNSLITPQPNKYAEILMPRFPIDRATNFIVEDESWTVIEYDHTSVPGTIYLSLTENKINLIYDDTELNIADTDKLAKYDFILPQEQQIFNINDKIVPTFVLMKNGTPMRMEDYSYTLTSTNKEIAKTVNGELIAIAPGEVKIIIQLSNIPNITYEWLISVQENTEQPVSGYIIGADFIRLDRTEEYTISFIPADAIVSHEFKLFKVAVEDKQENQLEPEYQPHPKDSTKVLHLIPNSSTTYELENDVLASFIKGAKLDIATVKISANNKNKLGYTMLGCIYNNSDIVFKPIEIRPLW